MERHVAWDNVTAELERAGWSYALDEFSPDGAVFVTVQAREPGEAARKHAWLAMGEALTCGAEGREVWHGPLEAVR